MPDVVIVGGGVIGLATAWKLTSRGAQVTVIEQSELGREASWAGAGMIPPGDLNDAATHALACRSAELWPKWSEALVAATGIDIGFRPCGALLLETDSTRLESLSAAWQQRGIETEWLENDALRELFPHLNATLSQAVLLPSQSQVRNPHYVQALVNVCRACGVAFETHTEVIGWQTKEHRVTAAVTEHARYEADTFIVAGGAWSTRLLSRLDVKTPVTPVRGQMVLFRLPEQRFTQVIELGSRYIVPRDDGHVLVGATEELVGWEKANTPEAVEMLKSFANEIVPVLTADFVETTWSGLRPRSESGRPLIGFVEGYDNVMAATGHFRAGLSNSPATAELVCQLLSKESPQVDAVPFAPC